MKTKLERWTRPANYIGPDWPDYYAFLGQHRGSDSVTRSNFERGLALIGGESATVRIVRERCSMAGWVEWIAIHESDTVARDKAQSILDRLDGYPVVDDDHLSELEWGEACEFWEGMTVRGRAILCRDAGVSIFAARRPYIPRDDSGYIFESLRG
jgi:hypothetical protein